jgi:signal transduction histidine kinase
MADLLAVEAGTIHEFTEIVVSASPDGIVAVDDDGTIRLCNPAAEALLGRPATELVGRQFGFPLAEGVAEIDLVLPRRRSRVVEMRVTSTIWENKRLHVASLRDITRRRQLEADLETALERQNNVVAVAAHEMRNPLTAIAVLAHTLRDPNATLSEDQRADVIDRIAERTNHLQALVRKLLSASMIETLSQAVPQRVPVLEFLLEHLSNFEPKNADVRLSCDPKLAAVVDRAHLGEILTNYVENAVAYGRPPVEIRVARRNNRVEIRVRDHGPGVGADFIPHLFERYSRDPHARQNTQGSGLGLWIVHNLAHANNGEAWYETGRNGGACFCLRLPADRARATNRQPTGHQRPRIASLHYPQA